ncbi:threonine synthase [Spirochaetia bacterium]|nr:threonine synthase [Spirochaetia bacterium]
MNPFSASRITESAFNFEPELQRLDEHFSLLKLYHGPTGTFKDFGMAFLAAVMEELLKNNGPALVLSASRGNTGLSIAHAFYQRRNIVSVILYPSGTIRGIDPETLITNGGSIIPIQINGNFDDCQRLIRNILEDHTFSYRYRATTANSLNIGRLLPQSLYYLFAFVKLKQEINSDFVFSVPTGNCGNLISGLYAWKFGMPVNGFIAAMNQNKPFDIFGTGIESSNRKSVATYSPAIDVSFPSNRERLGFFYDEAPAVMHNMVFPTVVTDSETAEAMQEIRKRYGIVVDPHTAVAFAAAQHFPCTDEAHIIVLATGHPARESAMVEQITGTTVDIPPRLAILSKESEPITRIEPDLEALEGAIASCF